MAFCDWLTKRQGGGRRYRLPSPEEARRYAAKTAALSAWCLDGDEFKLTDFTDRKKVSRALNGMSHLLELRHFAAFNRVRVRSLTRVLNLADILLAIRQILNPADTLDSKPTRGDANNPDYGRARDLAHALARALDRSLDRASSRSLDRKAGLEIDHALDLALRLALSLSLARNLELTGYIDLTRKFACYLAKGLASTLQQEPVVAHIEQNNLPEAWHTAEALLTKLDTKHRPDQSMLITQDAVKARLTQLLNDILAAATAQTELAVRQTQRKYAVHMLEYAYVGIRVKQSPDHVAWWQRLLYVHKEEDDAQPKPEQDRLEMDVSELYWWLQVIMARENGSLPAWEGIRIVGEQSLNN